MKKLQPEKVKENFFYTYIIPISHGQNAGPKVMDSMSNRIGTPVCIQIISNKILEGFIVDQIQTFMPLGTW